MLSRPTRRAHRCKDSRCRRPPLAPPPSRTSLPALALSAPEGSASVVKRVVVWVRVRQSARGVEINDWIRHGRLPKVAIEALHLASIQWWRRTCPMIRSLRLDGKTARWWPHQRVTPPIIPMDRTKKGLVMAPPFNTRRHQTHRLHAHLYAFGYGALGVGMMGSVRPLAEPFLATY